MCMLGFFCFIDLYFDSHVNIAQLHYLNCCAHISSKIFNCSVYSSKCNLI